MILLYPLINLINLSNYLTIWEITKIGKGSKKKSVLCYNPLKRIVYDTRIPSSNFGWVRAFSLAVILKSTKPHDFAHYVHVWGDGRKRGGHNLVKKNYCFFHVSDHFKQFSRFFSHHYIFFKKLIILMDGGYPPMENSMKIIF